MWKENSVESVNLVSSIWILKTSLGVHPVSVLDILRNVTQLQVIKKKLTKVTMQCCRFSGYSKYTLESSFAKGIEKWRAEDQLGRPVQIKYETISQSEFAYFRCKLRLLTWSLKVLEPNHKMRS